jgi:hypothetical protein
MADPGTSYGGITVGELIRHLTGFHETDPVCFGPDGRLTFYRVKNRGGVVQIEFNQTPVVQDVQSSGSPNCVRCGGVSFTSATQTFDGTSGVLIYCSGCGAVAGWGPKT